MNNVIIFWLIIFALSALVFFAIAAVVTVKGFADLRILLRYSEQGSEPQSELENGEEKQNKNG